MDCKNIMRLYSNSAICRLSASTTKEFQRLDVSFAQILVVVTDLLKKLDCHTFQTWSSSVTIFCCYNHHWTLLAYTIQNYQLNVRILIFSDSSRVKVITTYWDYECPDFLKMFSVPITLTSTYLEAEIEKSFY